ncbi:AMP-binding protein [Dermabacteraceae bacterium TAE3-ERU5]|nr:AMP-binding protein [Dermabacteraceae bacterium TAE3-ERU5]
MASPKENEEVFRPDPRFAENANAHAGLYQEAARNSEDFWRMRASLVSWSRYFTAVREGEGIRGVRWFVGGELNACFNCVDRQVDAGYGDQDALIFEARDGSRSVLSYSALLAEVCRMANVLTQLGVSKGQRVAIVMPTLPETVIAMLACARIGAVHAVSAQDTGADVLTARFVDARPSLVLTSAKALATCREALSAAGAEGVALLVLDGPADGENSHSWRALRAEASESAPVVPVAATDPLFALYAHAQDGREVALFYPTGGFLVQSAYTHRNVFDLKPGSDVYWCTAPISTIAGHSYLVYAPLLNRVPQVICEEDPQAAPERTWEIIARNGVSGFFTSPAQLRSQCERTPDPASSHDLSSLRVLGCGGDPIDRETWLWYREAVGGSRCPIVNTWGQKETGTAVISPLPGVTATKPGCLHRPLPALSAEVRGAQDEGGEGALVLTTAWPSLAFTSDADSDYFDRFFPEGKDAYYTGDTARYDADGDLWLTHEKK